MHSHDISFIQHLPGRLRDWKERMCGWKKFRLTNDMFLNRLCFQACITTNGLWRENLQAFSSWGGRTNKLSSQTKWTNNIWLPDATCSLCLHFERSSKCSPIEKLNSERLTGRFMGWTAIYCSRGNHDFLQFAMHMASCF